MCRRLYENSMQTAECLVYVHNVILDRKIYLGLKCVSIFSNKVFFLNLLSKPDFNDEHLRV